MALHSELTGSDLHDVKGVETATAGQVLSADGLGASQWVDPIALSNIAASTPLLNKKTTGIDPGSQDNPVVCQFDSTVSDAYVTMDASGTITFSEAGLYYVTFYMCMGSNSATDTAIFLARVLLNDVQYSPTLMSRNFAARSYSPATYTILKSFAANDVLKTQVMIDSTGNNAGSLYAFDVTLAGWDTAPSYAVSVTKLTGAE